MDPTFYTVRKFCYKFRFSLIIRFILIKGFVSRFWFIFSSRNILFGYKVGGHWYRQSYFTGLLSTSTHSYWFTFTCSQLCLKLFMCHLTLASFSEYCAHLRAARWPKRSPEGEGWRSCWLASENGGTQRCGEGSDWEDQSGLSRCGPWSGCSFKPRGVGAT